VSYVYRRRSETELRQIAEVILEKFPNRRIGEFAIDIEGIQEDLGLEIIFRPSLGLSVAGYLAQDPRYIVLNELQLVYLPRARFTISEEVCHKILEWKLWDSPQIPDGAHAHQLSQKQYDDIEVNARCLAAEILEPVAPFGERYESHRTKCQSSGLQGDALIKSLVRATAEDFIVSPYAAAYRAKKLGLMSAAEHARNYPKIGVIL
jgi:Zn-dependent peptidase ImmA (M78 family)